MNFSGCMVWRRSARSAVRLLVVAFLGVIAFGHFGQGAISTLIDAGPASGSVATNGQPRPVSYNLSARWAPANRTLVATESIRFRNGGPGTLPVVWLRLWPNDATPGEADGCTAPHLKLERVQGATVARYAEACSAVALRMPVALAPGRTAAVRLQFTVSVPTDNALFGRSAGIDLFGRVVPVMAVRDAAGWHLDPDSSAGDPAYTLAAAWQATLRVPAAVDVASTGVTRSNVIDSRSGERVVVASTAHSRDFGFAAGRMHMLRKTVDGTAIRVFSSSGTSRADAASALSDAVRVVRTYNDWYGSYGSGELDLVLTSLSMDSQELPEIVFTDPGMDFVAHEVAHQWFYGIVGNDQYREPWLDESFASWSEEQFAPDSYPCNPLSPLGSHIGGLARGLSYYETRPAEYVDVIYRGGSCALTTVAQQLGRTRFLALLHREVAVSRYRVVHTDDFMTLLAQADPAVATSWANLVGLPPAAG